MSAITGNGPPEASPPDPAQFDYVFIGGERFVYAPELGDLRITKRFDVNGNTAVRYYYELVVRIEGTAAKISDTIVLPWRNDRELIGTLDSWWRLSAIKVSVVYSALPQAAHEASPAGWLATKDHMVSIAARPRQILQ